MEHTRRVDVVDGHAVTVTVSSGGDWWTRYVCIPRPARAVFRAVCERWVAPETPEASYSPTGRAYWQAPRVLRRRRFVVIVQSGGLDV